MAGCPGLPSVKVMSTILASSPTIVARTLAQRLLGGLHDRWLHTIGVARRAEELAVTVDPADRDVLVVSAWLHDIGYGPSLHMTGFHPLDGAHYLLRHGWSLRVAGLVAHHSGADFTAEARDLGQALCVYPDERSAVSDALCYADQTVGPTGQPLPLRLRMAEMLARHGPDSVQARVHASRAPYLVSAAQRVERRLVQQVGSGQLAGN